MNEKTFRDFGEALDLLEMVMGNSEGEFKRVLKENFGKLNELYRDVKGSFGYTDKKEA